jgi:hypothetical protein
MSDRVRVLYITGWLRSGSTILGNLLNELPGVLHGGEIHYLYRNGLLLRGTNSLCGCGEQVVSCPLWSAVLDSYQVPDLGTLAETMVTRQRAVLRTRHIAARMAETRPRPEVTAALDQMAATYRVLAASGGDRLVVDSSKYPTEAATLCRRPDLDVRVLHIVRDPRAVAYSYQHSKGYIAPMRPSESTANWLGFNIASELAGAAAGAGRYLRVRHEDLASRPAEVMATVMRFAQLDGEPPVAADGTAWLGVNHTVTGNPDRLKHGAVTIRPDTRWSAALSARQVAVVTGLALPLLRRYGYPLRPAQAREPAPVLARETNRS